VEDFSFVLDELSKPEVVKKLVPNRHPDNALDTDHVPIYGHSLGGGAATVAMGTGETRIAGVLSIDGPVPPIKGIYTKDFKNPYMLINSQENLGDLRWDKLWPQLNWALQIDMHHSVHGTFLDYGLLAHLMGIKTTPELAHLLGTIPGERVVEVMNEYVHAYLQFLFTGKEPHLLERESEDFPEMEFIRSKGM
jgi:pimeloyl-ACP methyl ester carboxylesterase